jgi:hypothetical protein
MYDKHAKRENAEETATRRAEKRQKHMSTREEALMCPAPEGVMETLKLLAKPKWLATKPYYYCLFDGIIRWQTY